MQGVFSCHSFILVGEPESAPLQICPCGFPTPPLSLIVRQWKPISAEEQKLHLGFTDCKLINTKELMLLNCGVGEDS